MGTVILSGCGDSAPSLLAVTAVAAGVPSLAPFFDEGEQLGRDEPDLTSLEPHSGLQQGSTPGLYGGTQKPKVCDVRKLEKFLTAPENKKKAQEWARIAKVDVDGIGNHLDELTPVLLRHDTLVKNHDYKKGRAVPFDALLESGIAVLVDDQGLPAVKCSCGNPLRAFDENPDRIEVEFAGDNQEWEGYDESAVVVVKPAPERLEEIKLVDVEDPDQGISRKVGSTGESDTTFDTRARQAVPKVRGMTFGEASAALADKGLAVTVAGDEMPPGDAPVTGSNPGPGTELGFGTAVALHVDWPGRTAEESTEERTDDPGSGPGSGSGGGSGSDSGSTGTETGTGPGPTEPSETERSSSGGSPSESGSTPTDRNTPPSGGQSSPTDGGPSPTESTTPPSTGGTSPAPSPSRSPEQPSPDPTPTSTPTLPSTPPSPSRSTRPPTTPAPDPTPPEDSGPPDDTPTAHDPDPTGDPPPDDPGDPGASGDPSGSGDPGDPGDPVEDPAQPVWI